MGGGGAPAVVSRPTRRRILRYGFGLAGLIFMAFALSETWDRSRETVFPDLPTLAIAEVLLVAGLVGAGLSWLALFGDNAPRRLLSDFYMAQLGKYIPGGGLWQAAGQIGLATESGYTASKVAGTFGVYAVVQLTAAAFLGGFTVLSGSAAPWVRFAALGALLTPLLMHRAWMAALLVRVARWTRRDPEELSPPPQGAIVRAWLWALIPIAAFGLAYGALVHDLDSSLGVVSAGVAFALAWAVGFALIPFPSGLGVREAALVVLVDGTAAVVIAASIALRLLAIVADLVLVAITRRRRP